MSDTSFVNRLRLENPSRDISRTQEYIERLFVLAPKIYEEEDLEFWVEDFLEFHKNLEIKQLESFSVIDVNFGTAIVVDLTSESLKLYCFDPDEHELSEIEEDLSTYIKAREDEATANSFSREDAYDISLVGLYYEIVTSIEGDISEENLSKIVSRILADLNYTNVDIKILDQSLRYYMEREGVDMDDYHPGELEIDYSKYF